MKNLIDFTSKAVSYFRENKEESKILSSSRFLVLQDEFIVISKTKFESDYLKEKYLKLIRSFKNAYNLEAKRETKFLSEIDFASSYSKKNKGILKNLVPNKYIMLLSLNSYFRGDIKIIRKELGIPKSGFTNEEQSEEWFNNALEQVLETTDYEKMTFFRLAFFINELCLRYDIPKDENETFLEDLILHNNLGISSIIREYKWHGNSINLEREFDKSVIAVKKYPEESHRSYYNNYLELELKIPLSHCNGIEFTKFIAKLKDVVFDSIKRTPLFKVRMTKTPFSYRDYVIYLLHRKELNSNQIHKILLQNYGIKLTPEHIRKICQRTADRVLRMVCRRDT